MSAPSGASINDSIGESVSSLSYVGVDDATKGIRRFGQGALLAKIDVRSAYRNVPIHPHDRWLLGMCWNGALFIDTALPFGLRSSAKIFTAIADAAEWIARKSGIQFVIHYLDDFLIIGAPASDECHAALRTLVAIFERLGLGLPLAIEKVEGPDMCLDFLGFELDSQHMQVRLPLAKLRELQTLLRSWVGRESCVKKDLESLTGKLAHAARVVKPGKTFMRRMYELLSGIKHDYHHVRISASCRSDILWWDTFLELWNETSIIHPLSLEKTARHFWTDASGLIGCGALNLTTNRWIQLIWPEHNTADEIRLREENITFKELLPIVLACAVWAEEFSGSWVIVHCDNIGAVELVNSGHSKVAQIMHLLRCLFFIRARFQVELWAVHVPGVENSLADAISCNNLSLLFSQIPDLPREPSPIPPTLVSLLLSQHLNWTLPDWTRRFSSCFRLD